VRYRCYHFAEEFARAGLLADVGHFEGFKNVHANRYDAFIFHKPKYSRRLVAVLNQLKEMGKTVVADYDDFVFSEAHADASPLYLCGRASIQQVRAMHRQYEQAMDLFQSITVSTEPLGEIVKTFQPGAQVDIVHNGLSAKWVAQGAYRFKEDRAEKVIGYFPGTSTHQMDFSVAEPALAQFLRRHREVRLLVMGPVKVDRYLFRKEQISTLPVVAYEQLPAWIMNCWASIAPLQESIFNRCKSALKLLETAIWNVPLIASPIPDLMRNRNKVSFARNVQEWEDRLEALLDDTHYAHTVKGHRSWAMDHCMAHTQAHRLLGALETF
jgi:glycosyltransferase involved in cell wall biosynthesis